MQSADRKNEVQINRLGDRHDFDDWTRSVLQALQERRRNTAHTRMKLRRAVALFQLLEGPATRLDRAQA